MKIDLTVSVSKETWNEIFKNEKMTAFGHVGTHFDVKNKEFSLDNTIRNGKIFDVKSITDRDIEINDIDSSEINKDDFVMFNTGYLKEVGYGTKEYYKSHPQLSNELIELLIEKKVSMIGIDAAGIRSGAEHGPIDQYCADKNIFVVENLDNLDILVQKTLNDNFRVYTFPIKMEGLDGLPCRVIAEI